MDGDPTMTELEAPRRSTPATHQILSDLQREEKERSFQYEDLGDIPMFSPSKSVQSDKSVVSAESAPEAATLPSEQAPVDGASAAPDEETVQTEQTELPSSLSVYSESVQTVDELILVTTLDIVDEDAESLSPSRVSMTPPPPTMVTPLRDTPTPTVSTVDAEIRPVDLHEGFNDADDNDDDDDKEEEESTAARQDEEEAQEMETVRVVRQVTKQLSENHEGATVNTTDATIMNGELVDDATDKLEHFENQSDDDDDESLLRASPTMLEKANTMIPTAANMDAGFASFIAAAGSVLDDACGIGDDGDTMDEETMEDGTMEDGTVDVDATDDEGPVDNDDEPITDEPSQHVFVLPQGGIGRAPKKENTEASSTISDVLMDGVVSLGMGVMAVGAAVNAAFDPEPIPIQEVDTTARKDAYDDCPSEELRQNRQHDIPSAHFKTTDAGARQILPMVSYDDGVDGENRLMSSDDGADGDNDDDGFDDDDDDDDDAYETGLDGDIEKGGTSILKLVDGTHVQEYATPERRHGAPQGKTLGEFESPQRLLVERALPQAAPGMAATITRISPTSANVDTKTLIARAQINEELNNLFREVEEFENDVAGADDYGPRKSQPVSPVFVRVTDEPMSSVVTGKDQQASPLAEKKIEKAPAMSLAALGIVAANAAAGTAGHLDPAIAAETMGISNYKYTDPILVARNDSFETSLDPTMLEDQEIDIENPPSLKHDDLGTHLRDFSKDTNVSRDVTEETECDVNLSRDACKVVGYEEPADFKSPEESTRKVGKDVERVRPNKMRYILISMIVLLILILVLSIGFGTGGFGGKSETGTSGVIGGPIVTAVPVPVPVPVPIPTVAPSVGATAVPTVGATAVPTVAPTLGPTLERSAAFAALFPSLMYDGGESLDDAGSPEAMAYNWIVNKDDLQLDPNDQSASNQMRISQRFGLATIYFNSVTAVWGDETEWLGLDECVWFGVTCGQNGEVVGISMPFNLLVGTLSNEIATLTNLVELNLNNNQLEGALPGSLASMQSLRVLAIQDNLFSGDLSVVDFSKLTGLRVFDGQSNSFEGVFPPTLYQATSLNILALDKNKISGSLSQEVGNLVELERFSLSDNGFYGPLPSELGLLRKLQLLKLATNQLTGTVPTEVGALSELRTLDFVGNALAGSLPSEFGRLAQLENLVLFGNLLVGQIPSQLGLCTSLLVLDAQNNLLSGTVPIELGSLSKVQYLRLGNNNFSGGPIPSSFFQLTALKQLHLYTMNLIGDVSTELGNLKNLESLRLDNNLLSGGLPSEVSNLVNLVDLRVSNNTFSGTVPTSIGSLTALTYLGLNINRFTGVLPGGIGSMLLLQTLRVENNLLFGFLPTTLTNLVNLELFYCGDNQFSGSLPANFGNMGGLVDFQCFRNRMDDARRPGITGPLPPNLDFMTNLQVFMMFQNGLTGVIPSAMGGMASLQRLDLELNFLSGTVPTELGSLSNLNTLQLGGNLLEDPLPSSLCELTLLDVYTVDCNMTCSCCALCGSRLMTSSL
jgi:Leucine-rich repeat (LRR) protein